MKNIYNFEQYNRVYENIDMMLLPSDPIAGMGDLYKKITNSIGNEMNKIVDSLTQIPTSHVTKIKDFMKKTFGTTKPVFTKENAEKLNDVLELDNISENFKKGENLAVKICARIKQFLGINIYAGAGLALGIIIGILMSSFVAIIGTMIACTALLFLFTKIMQIFGYGDNDTDVATVGHYDPSQDIRNKW
jgi:hypothetical protein